MRELPSWVRWLLAGRFVNALGSMAWVFVPLYLVSDRHLDEATAGSVAAVWGGAVDGMKMPLFDVPCAQSSPVLLPEYSASRGVV